MPPIFFLINPIISFHHNFIVPNIVSISKVMIHQVPFRTIQVGRGGGGGAKRFF